MPKISDAAIATAAFNAGISRDKVATAVAIALAESGGDTHAHNPIPPDDSYGLWQINMLGSMGPDRRQRLGITSNEALYDANVNAKAMAMISSNGGTWQPWTTYTRGNYLAFMARGYAARDNIGSTTPTTPVIGPTVPSLATIVAFVKLMTNKGMWIRFGLFTIGFGITAIALVKLTGDNQLSAGTKKLIATGASFIPGTGKAVSKIVAAKGVVK